MAEILTTFDKIAVGSATFSGTENFVDLLANTADTPIPAGSRIWIGFVTCIAQDKGATFELRPNLPGKSVGNVADTQLRGFTTVPSGDSKDMDVYYNGNILTLAPVLVPSTGIEKLWMRIKSISSAAATYEYITYYTIY